MENGQNSWKKHVTAAKKGVLGFSGYLASNPQLFFVPTCSPFSFLVHEFFSPSAVLMRGICVLDKPKSFFFCARMGGYDRLEMALSHQYLGGVLTAVE